MNNKKNIIGEEGSLIINQNIVCEIINYNLTIDNSTLVNQWYADVTCIKDNEEQASLGGEAIVRFINNDNISIIKGCSIVCDKELIDDDLIKYHIEGNGVLSTIRPHYIEESNSIN